MMGSIMSKSTTATGTHIEELDLSAWEGPNRFAIVIHNVFTQEECQSLIDRSELNGYGEALVNVGGGAQMKMTDFRNSDRSIIDDPIFAEEMWSRIRNATNDDPRLMCPPWALRSKSTQSQFQAVGLNERLRFLRYDKGNYFASHSDGAYFRGNEAGEARRGERSLVTCQLYLNESFEGGATRFVSNNESQGFDVVPRTGSVLLFDHRLCHEGSILLKGRKYAIRTDVMFTNKGEGFDYSINPISNHVDDSSENRDVGGSTDRDSGDSGSGDGACDNACDDFKVDLAANFGICKTCGKDKRVHT